MKVKVLAVVSHQRDSPLASSYRTTKLNADAKFSPDDLATTERPYDPLAAMWMCLHTYSIIPRSPYMAALLPLFHSP